MHSPARSDHALAHARARTRINSMKRRQLLNSAAPEAAVPACWHRLPPNESAVCRRNLAAAGAIAFIAFHEVA